MNNNTSLARANELEPLASTLRDSKVMVEVEPSTMYAVQFGHGQDIRLMTGMRLQSYLAKHGRSRVTYMLVSEGNARVFSLRAWLAANACNRTVA